MIKNISHHVRHYEFVTVCQNQQKYQRKGKSNAFQSNDGDDSSEKEFYRKKTGNKVLTDEAIDKIELKKKEEEEREYWLKIRQELTYTEHLIRNEIESMVRNMQSYLKEYYKETLLTLTKDARQYCEYLYTLTPTTLKQEKIRLDKEKTTNKYQAPEFDLVVSTKNKFEDWTSKEQFSGNSLRERLWQIVHNEIDNKDSENENVDKDALNETEPIINTNHVEKINNEYISLISLIETQPFFQLNISEYSYNQDCSEAETEFDYFEVTHDAINEKTQRPFKSM